MVLAKRLDISGRAGYQGTDEMLYLAEMLGVQIEIVDLKDPMTLMTTYGERGPYFLESLTQTLLLTTRKFAIIG